MYPSLDHETEPPVPDYEIVTETITVNSLLSGDGIRLIFTTVVPELQRLRRSSPSFSSR